MSVWMYLDELEIDIGRDKQRKKTLAINTFQFFSKMAKRLFTFWKDLINYETSIKVFKNFCQMQNKHIKRNLKIKPKKKRTK